MGYKRKRALNGRIFLENAPWYMSYKSAKDRCNDKKHNSYRYYGAKGIKFNLDPEEIEYLWNRDNALGMHKPTLDRIDNNGNYEFNNCRFLEATENSRRSHYGRTYINYPHKTIYMYDMDGNMVAEFKNAVFASKETGIRMSTIRKVIHGSEGRKQSHGWRFSYVRDEKPR